MNFPEFCERGFLMGEMRYRKYEREGFQTRSGKFEISSSVMKEAGVSPLPVYREPPLSPMSTPDIAEKFPLILMSGSKVKFFFHSELRQIESLRGHNPDPLVEIHPDTAAALGIHEGDWVWVESPRARVRMKAKLFDGLAPGVASAQHAWWFPEEAPPEYGWKRSNVNLLYGDTHFDPESGTEPLKCSLCRVYPAEY
jgi:anaerobic selenocysteine-containing dehydrogenase